MIGDHSCAAAAASHPANTTAATEWTEPAPLSRGVTADTIKIGGAFIDVEDVRQQFGVDLGNTPDEVIPALIAGMNADGGINGRQVEYVDRLDSTPSEASSRSCDAPQPHRGGAPDDHRTVHHLERLLTALCPH